MWLKLNRIGKANGLTWLCRLCLLCLLSWISRGKWQRGIWGIDLCYEAFPLELEVIRDQVVLSRNHSRVRRRISKEFRGRRLVGSKFSVGAGLFPSSLGRPFLPWMDGCIIMLNGLTSAPPSPLPSRFLPPTLYPKKHTSQPSTVAERQWLALTVVLVVWQRAGNGSR